MLTIPLYQSQIFVELTGEQQKNGKTDTHAVPVGVSKPYDVINDSSSHDAINDSTQCSENTSNKEDKISLVFSAPASNSEDQLGPSTNPLSKEDTLHTVSKDEAVSYTIPPNREDQPSLSTMPPSSERQPCPDSITLTSDIQPDPIPCSPTIENQLCPSSIPCMDKSTLSLHSNDQPHSIGVDILASNADEKSTPRSSSDVIGENGESCFVSEEKCYLHEHMPVNVKDKPPSADDHSIQIVTLDSKADDVKVSGRDTSCDEKASCDDKASGDMSCDDKAPLLSSENGGIGSQGV